MKLQTLFLIRLHMEVLHSGKIVKSRVDERLPTRQINEEVAENEEYHS